MDWLHSVTCQSKLTSHCALSQADHRIIESSGRNLDFAKSRACKEEFIPWYEGMEELSPPIIDIVI